MEILVDRDKQIITEKIDCFFSELIQKYEAGKYDELEYQRLLRIFQQPAQVGTRDIEDVLAWKYGKTRENLLKKRNYTSVISLFQNNWQDYIEKEITSGEEAFIYWQKKIGTSFISVAFMVHLLFPNEIPIVDQHTFRGARYFLELVNFNHNIKQAPNSLSEIHMLNKFVHVFSERLGKSLREFDKYLMMFGKHVAPR